MKKTESKKKLILIALGALLITVIGATYAYFTAQKGSGGSANIEVGAGTTDSLQFTNGEKINIIANQDNFKKDGVNQSGNSSVTATLTPNNTTKEASDMYNVYLVIEDNEFIYTTEDSEPELVLKVVNPESTEVTSMNAVKYIEGVGFDITELKPGIYPIVKGYNISASEDPKIDNWEITVTLINLNKDQNKNAGKSFTGKVYITKDDLKENDLIKVNSIASTTTTSTINVDLKIGQEIGKVDKYYFAIEETTEKPEDIQTESVTSALAKEYEESTTATYEFTEINEKPLKEQQNYKIYGYGIDTKGFRSNIYETIVTTEEYQIPTIENVSHEENDNSTTFTITGQGGTSNISKYQYSIDGKTWNDTSDATGTITISELEYNKSYDIRIRAIDEQERYSNIWVETIKIIKLGTEEYPYSINTVEDLLKLSTEVNEGNPHTGEFYKLEKDIDFQNKESYEDSEAIVETDLNGDGNKESILLEMTTNYGFNPIGMDGNYFSGVFDGNNKKISNLYVSYGEKKQYLALFGYVKNGYIKNLTVSGDVSTEIATPMGGMVNLLENSTLENCINKVNVLNKFNTYAVGGLVSWINNGDNYIKNCQNLGTVQGGGYLGGLVGGHQGGTLTIENSHNEGKIENNIGNCAGGLIGSLNDKAQELIIKNSSNTGEILSSVNNENEKVIGGIVGNNAIGNITLENVVNKGTISNPRKEYNNFVRDDVGGLIGHIYAKSTVKITNSHNDGKIVGGTYTGGLVGYNNGILTLNKTYNINLIDASGLTFAVPNAERASTVTGGLVGFSDGVDAYTMVLNSFNKGEVKGTDIITGILGLSNNASSFNYVINSYNTGNVTVNTANDASSIARVVSANNTGYLNNVYNIGDIKGFRASYGVGFLASPNNTMLNSYYKDKNSDGTTITGANSGNNPTALNDAILKNQQQMENGKYFYEVLNTNIESINLLEINTLLNGYELENWKKGTDGYPILDYQTE